jgi:ELWxxDGT repeat protein
MRPASSDAIADAGRNSVLPDSLLFAFCSTGCVVFHFFKARLLFDFLVKIRRSLHTTCGFKRNQPRKSSRSELLETRQLLAADFQLLMDINTVTDSDSELGDFVNIGDTVYFTADDRKYGRELWKSDGTAAGTVMVKDIRSGDVNYHFMSSNPKFLTNVNGTLYFTADDGTNGRELWKSNGTAAGTVMVKDIRSGDVNYHFMSSDPANLTNVNGTLYFTADDGTNGTELWKSNGTVAGTTLVKDILRGCYAL